MANAIQTVDNLIQGVSQQAAQNRRLTQCEEQFDCLNQPVEGCVARPGLEMVKRLFTGSANGRFHAPIFRDLDERYQVILGNGSLRVFNLLDGSEASVSSPGGLSYLNCSGTPSEVFSVAAAEDVIFVANTERTPAIGTAKSPSRPQEAMFYFKAGSYLTTYVISITFENVVYQWQYQSPDNSVVTNAEHITTSALCYALYNAMVTDPVNSPTAHLGFNMERKGSIMRIWRNDGAAFFIDVQDGQGNTQLLGFKDTVGGFEKLPQSGFEGMVFKVLGDVKDDADDYYVEFTGGSSTGVWEECVKPDTPITLNPATMPYQLKNIGYNSFTFEPAPWGNRVAGDPSSSKNPSFIGKRIIEVAFDNSRLLFLTSGTAVWSRNRNPYVFFPDTVQAKLATAPVDYEVKASKRIAVLSTVLQTDAATYLWAENRQFKIDTADQPFAAETISIPPSTSFEFNDKVPPVPVGESVLFVHDNGPWSGVTDIQFRQGDPAGSTGLTDHAPKYVPKGLTWMDATDTAKKAVFFSPSEPNHLFLYEWHYSEGRRVLSAWQTWRLPGDCSILWGVFDRSTLYLTVQRPDGVYLLKCSLAPYQVDPDADAKYLTRLDLRVTEAAMSLAYNTGTQRTTITLPYLVPDPANYRLVSRAQFGGISRGTQLDVISWAVVNGVSVATVPGNMVGMALYGGWRVSSERVEGQFFPRDQEGAYAHTERTTVGYYSVAHSDSGYYRIEKLNAVTREVEARELMTGRYNGDPENQFGEPVLKTGSTKIAVAAVNDQFRIRLINDTFLPSAWQSAVWHYDAKVPK